jgi:peptide/nickel transport system substrate-binding protein
MNRIRTLAVLLALAMAASACTESGSNATQTSGTATLPAPVEATGEVQMGGELLVGIVSESNSWYPPEAEWAFAAGEVVADAFYETLYMRTGTGEFLPHLAASDAVPNADGTEWTVTLRPGITFHDGTPLDADALLEMGALWDEGRFATLGEGVETTSKVDDLTVTYNLHDPDPAFVSTLAGRRGAAFSPAAARAFGDSAGENPVGTGPFVFQSWTRDSQLVATRNPNYWQDGPYLDKITFRVLVDVNSRMASLESGDIDVVSQGGVDGVLAMIDKGFTGYSHKGNGAGLTVYNTLNPPMDDVRVRRAVSYAINTDDINTVNPGQISGEIERRSQFFAPSSKWYDPEIESVYAYYDTAKAEELMADYVADPARSDGKAVGDPIAFSYVCNPAPANRLTSQLFLQAWDDAGFEVNLIEEEQGTMITRVVGGPTQDPPFLGDFHATCWADGTPNPPYSVLNNRFGPVAENVLNFSNYTNPAIDAELDVLQTSLDFDEQYAAVSAISTVLAEEMPLHWWGTGVTLVLIGDRVKNVDNFTWPDGSAGGRLDRGRMWFTNVWVDDAEPLDIPTGLVELPATTTTTAPPIVEAPVNDAILAVLPGAPETMTDTDPTFDPVQCPGGEPLADLSPVSQTVKSFAGATAFGPFAGAIVLEFPDGEAEQYMASYAANVEGPCAAYKTTAASGAPLSLGFAPSPNQLSLGDQTASWDIRGDSDGFPVNSDIIQIRRGNTVIQIYWLVIGGLPDPANVEALATAADSAVAGLG